MILAGHYPRQHFTVAELATMHVYEAGYGKFAKDGWNRSTDSRGKPLVFYAPGIDDPKPHCIVRPVVRVKAKCVPSLSVLIKRAVAAVERMTPAERAAMDKAQRESWARGEAGLGLD